MLSALGFSIATNESSNRKLIMSIIFMSVLAVLVLVAQPTLAGSGGGGGGGEKGKVAVSTSPNMRRAKEAVKDKDMPTAFSFIHSEIKENPKNLAPWLLLSSMLDRIDIMARYSAVHMDEAKSLNHVIKTTLMPKALVLLQLELEKDRWQGFAGFDSERQWKGSAFVRRFGPKHVLNVETVFIHAALAIDPKNRDALLALASNHLKMAELLMESDSADPRHLRTALHLAVNLKKGCYSKCGPIDELLTKLNVADALRAKYKVGGLDVRLFPGELF